MTSSSRTPLPPVVARRAGALLNLAAESAREAGDQALAPFGLTVKHFGVLTFIRHEGEGADEFHSRLTGAETRSAPGLSQQAIADRLRIDRTTMVGVIDELEAKGLVRRERNPADRRAYIIRVTPKGTKLQGRALQAIDKQADLFFAPLTKKERETLAALLLRLIERES